MIDIYNAAIETAILLLLVAWMFMDRMGIYFRKNDDG